MEGNHCSCKQGCAGTKLKPHFVQLYWLLTGYYSQYADMGAVGFVICQP